MKRGSFFIERAGRPTITVTPPLRFVRARMVSDTEIVYGGLHLVDPHPICALCRALKAAGQPDSALLVSYGSTGAVILSVHDTAWSPERLAR